MLTVALMLFQCGCSAKLDRQTGFLSDCSSKLERQSDGTYRYIGPYLGRYSKFIVDRGKAHLHTGSKAGRLSADDMTDMQDYSDRTAL